MIDWFRQTDWNTEIAALFFKKLARARTDSRAQYLKIQAITLIDTREPLAMHAAEGLIQKLFIDYLDNRLDRSQCFKCLGDIYKLREDLPAALECYKQAIDFETTFPNVQTSAYLDFAEVVIKLETQEFYIFAESLLLARIKGSPFPIERYKAFSFSAIINFRLGNVEKAIALCALADDSAKAKTSDIRNHKYLGVVEERLDWVEKLINRYKNEMLYKTSKTKHY